MQSLSNGNSPRSSARQSPFRSPRVWIGIPVSLFFLFLALRGQHPDEIRDAFSRVDWRILPLALLLLYSGIAVRAYRWHVLLRPVHDIPTRDVFPVMIIGYAANNVLPLRAGELVRAWVLEQRYGVRKTAALATIAVERLFDGVTMLLFVGGAATVIGLNAELRHVALVAAVIFAAAIAGLIFLLVGGALRERLLRLVLGPLPDRLATRVERMAESFLAGLGVLTRRGDLALVAITSVVAWGFETSMYWMVARAFGDPLAGAMTPSRRAADDRHRQSRHARPLRTGIRRHLRGGRVAGGQRRARHWPGAGPLLRGPAPCPALAAGHRLGRHRVVAPRHRGQPAHQSGARGRGRALPGCGATGGLRRRESGHGWSGRGRVTVWQAIVLGIVQGLTEFLPVSSSAHLLVVPWLLGWESPGLAFDAALHLGTLAAVLVYFWRDLLAMALALPRAIRRPCAILRSDDPADVMPRLALLIALGTVPGLIAGLLGEGAIDAVYHPGGVAPDAGHRRCRGRHDRAGSASARGGARGPACAGHGQPHRPRRG